MSKYMPRLISRGRATSNALRELMENRNHRYLKSDESQVRALEAWKREDT